MPKTIGRMYEGQIIGGIFAKRHDADGAIEALQELEISSDDIEEFVQLDKTHSKEAHIEILSERGFAEAQAIYYDKLIREGNILLVVYNVTDPSPIHYCESGRENLCEKAKFNVYTLDGGYAEYMVTDERFCFSIPDSYSDAHAAPLLCAGLIGYRSLVKAGDAESVGIYGFGAADAAGRGRIHEVGFDLSDSNFRSNLSAFKSK